MKNHAYMSIQKFNGIEGTQYAKLLEYQGSLWLGRTQSEKSYEKSQLHVYTCLYTYD